MQRMVMISCGALLVLLIVIQVGMEFTVATHSTFLEWPFPWDNNRYFDYLLFYRDSVTDGGWAGLLQAYRERPPYSAPLLASSLPVLLIWNDLRAVQLHLFLYVALLDLGALIIAYRLTRSWSAALTAVAVLHFTTLLIGYSKPEFVVYASRYATYFPHASLNVFAVAMVLEGLYTKRPAVWASVLLLALVAALTTRPPAAPLPAAIAFLPACLLLAWSFRCGRRRLVVAGAMGVLLAVAILGVHYFHILPRTLEYFRGATSNPAFQKSSKTEWVFWYYWRGRDLSDLFVPALVLLVVSSVMRAARLWLAARCSRRDRWLATRPLLAFAFCAWAVFLSWLAPTLSAAKSAEAGYTFAALTMILGTVAFWLLAADIRKRSAWNSLLSLRTARALPAVWVVLVVMGSAGLLAREYGDVVAIREGRRADPFAERKVFERRVFDQVAPFVYDWCGQHQRKGTWIGFWGEYDVLNAHNFRIREQLQGRPPQYDIRTANIIPGRDGGFRPELILLPVAPDGPAAFQAVAALLAAVDYDEAQTQLQQYGYRRIDRIEITSELAFEVLQYREPVPLPDKFGWP